MSKLKSQSASERTSGSESRTTKRSHKRAASLYDAVAGRVGTDGFIPEVPVPYGNKDKLSHNTVPVFPEAVLFRRKSAPEWLYGANRAQGEDDLYWANEHLGPEQPLPESDLLKALHVYASDFYGRATSDKGTCDFRSMDETALLALGILLDESAKHCLGEKGHLVFVEGQEDGDETGEPMTSSESSREGSVESDAISDPEEGRQHKKRKIDHESSESATD